MHLLDGLNEMQQQAVSTTEGPVMVMAGAGSGKTRVLTHRIAYLIEELGIPSNQILAVTFTNKAAMEMKERVSKLLDRDVRNMWISTFHACCVRILRKDILYLNKHTRDFVIIDEEDALRLIRDILKSLEIDKKEFNPKVLKDAISKIKNKVYIPSNNPYTEEIVDKVYLNYQKVLQDENLLDFDDLIIMTIEIFEKFPHVLEYYQNLFQYIMIDEFQDTNSIQYHLINLLAQKSKNIFVVGDQDQSIYSFRGARIENIDLFQKDYSNTKIILLEQNYRSVKNILNLANSLIEKNQKRIKKNLFTVKTFDNLPVYYRAESGYAEAIYVKEKIEQMLNEGYNYSDIAILYRANAISRLFEDIFIKYKIPYRIYGGVSFYRRKEIKDIICYLRLITNLDCDFAFKRIINEPKRKIGDSVVEKLTAIKDQYHVSLFAAIDYAEGIVSKQKLNALLDFKFMILELQERIEDCSIDDFIDLVLQRTTYLEMLQAQNEEGLDRLANIYELKSILSDVNEDITGSNYEKLSVFLSDVALKTDADEIDDKEDFVKMMTFHQAKGLEFKVVFMVVMEQGIFPNQLIRDHNDLEEERRICYVGITRAMERLFLTNAINRRYQGMITSNNPSQFIKEMDAKYLEAYGHLNGSFENNYTRRIKIVADDKPINKDYKVGDKINHATFGDGLVVGVDSKNITVAFSVQYGIKKLVANHPSIRKI